MVLRGEGNLSDFTRRDLKQQEKVSELARLVGAFIRGERFVHENNWPNKQKHSMVENRQNWLSL